METELRPLSLGEILDRTFHLYRAHFRLFAGIGAVAAAARLAITALNLAITRGLAHAGKPGLAATVSSSISSLVVAAVTLIASALVVAAVTRAVTAVYLGESITVREAYQTVLPRTLRFLGISLAALFLAWWPALLLGALVAAMAVATRTSAAPQAQLLPGIVAVSLLPAFFLGLWLFLRYTLSSAACVYEGLTVRASLRRSKLLSRGTRARIFVLLLLAGVLQTIFILAFLAPRFGSLRHSHVSTGVTIYGLLVGFAATCLTTPIYSIGLTLFYLDARVRKEGFDIEWLLRKGETAQPSPDAGLRGDPALG